MSEQTEQYLVETQRGHYNLLNSRDVDVSVRVLRPGHKPICFTVSADYLSELRPDERWSYYLDEACALFLRKYISSQSAEVKALADWVDDTANARALDTVWAQRRVQLAQAAVARAQDELREAEATLNRLRAAEAA